MALVNRDTPQAEEKLKKILMDRACARNNFIEFCSYIAPHEPPALHHRLLCNALEKVAEGKIMRLMVFMPPGSAKSTYGSKNFPAYYLGKYPGKSIICGSYGEGLSTLFGKAVRNIVLSPEYGKLFDTRLSEDTRAKGEWETKDGGSYYAVGVGSGVTGRRSDLNLIDDPVKGRKDADSALIREDIWNWYLSDFTSRLKLDVQTAQIIIQTRWHEDDLSGRILPDDWNFESGEFIGFDGETWTVICLPAEAEKNDILGRKEGEWLWPESVSPEKWKVIKNTQTAKDMRNWSALYQQRPQPDSGIFFQRQWFNRFKLGEEPLLSMYCASDYAVSEGKGDSTEHGAGGFDKINDLYFTGWWSGQTTPDIWIESQLKMAKTFEPLRWLAEVGVIRRAVEPFLKKRMGDKDGTYFTMEWMPHIGDKAANARSFQAIASMGKVWIPYGNWGEALLDQLVRFIPNSNFKDDKVDVCGLFGRILDQTFAPTEPTKEETIKRDSYGFDEPPSASWKLN